MTLDLLPPPKKIKNLPGFCATGKIKKEQGSLPRPETGAYSIHISPTETLICANDPSGFFYASRTMDQIDARYPKKRPCLKILDWPDFPVRGFYHDVTRGKVPKLKTLLELADTCARFKINHLELYIEHTYAFKNHPEVWQNADPLTAAEIRTLDAHCAKLHIDLVPSFSTFGHFYTWIHRKFPELNELERDVSQEPFCWLDRMMHYTLDCQNPRSLKLVAEIISEVAPLFRSKYFNICCDETFDLGKGKNKILAEKKGSGRLYVDFLTRIMALVRKEGRIPLFWGDIIGAHPELLHELPEDAIALDWEYSSRPERSKAATISRTGRPFYVCPGINSWNQWLPGYGYAHQNITRMAKHGRKWGAIGLLNTDWGDYGHINSLGPALPGLVLGASASWNSSSKKLAPEAFDPQVSRLALGDPSGKLAGLLRRASEAPRARWRNFCHAHQPRSRELKDPMFEPNTGLPLEIFKHPARIHANALAKIKVSEKRILAFLRRSPLVNSILAKEIQTGLLGLRAMEEYHIFCHRISGRTQTRSLSPAAMANLFRELDNHLSGIWKKRNKPSEYFRIREVLKNAETHTSGMTAFFYGKNQAFKGKPKAI